MLWYDVDLDENGVQALNTLFDEPPYRVVIGGAYSNASTAVFDGGGEGKLFMRYDKGKIIIFSALFRTLPQEVQEDIKQRMALVDSLSDLVRKI